MAIKRHIQVPAGVLKHFSYNGEKELYYLDLQDTPLQIKSDFAANIGSSEDYYSDGFDGILSCEIESKATDLFARIRRYLNGDTKVLPERKNAAVIIKNYVINMYFRSNSARNSFLEHSYTAFMCSEQENHDAFVSASLKAMPQIREQFAKTRVGTINNQTEIGFVLPRNGFYSACKCKLIIVPIAPQYAIFLEFTESAKQEELDLIAIDNRFIIDQLNLAALKNELYSNSSFVVSDSRDVLEKLKVNVPDLIEELKNDADTDFFV